MSALMKVRSLSAGALPPLDDRDEAGMVDALLALRPGYAPEWQPSRDGIDMALVHIAARYLYAISQRLNQAPQKNLLAFLALLGLRPVPPRPARVPVVFTVPENSTDRRLPAGSRLAAPPPPESASQVVFETERYTGLSVARLRQVYSHWPGRDQYIDHTAAQQGIQPFRLFEKKALQDIPHYLYLAHNTLLALAGDSQVRATFDLVTPGSEHLDLIWEYCDGKVWREFLKMRPDCDETEAARLDSTRGLRNSGVYLLEADCAEAKKTTVHGIEGYWVRARLCEPLPPIPSQILPLVDTVTLSTLITNPLNVLLEPTGKHSDEVGKGIDVYMNDKDGAPLRGLEVRSSLSNSVDLVPASGMVTLDDSSDYSNTTIVVNMGDFAGSDKLPDGSAGKKRITGFTLSVDGIAPEQAFNDAIKLDASKPFFPFGLQPQPGSAFYFSSEEIFSKPGAQFQVYVQPARTPQDDLSLSGSPQVIAHTVNWEYWDGYDWRALPPNSTFATTNTLTYNPGDFTGTGIVQFTVPDNLEPVMVNEMLARWVRVRLVSGGYGYRSELNVDGSALAVVITQPPSLGRFLLGYAWEYGQLHPEHVLTENDFQFTEQTEANKWEGLAYEPFQSSTDTTPALYLGFDKKLPVDRLNLFFNIQEARGESHGPALRWEYHSTSGWKTLTVDDETNHLRVPGMVSFIGMEDAAPLHRFGAPQEQPDAPQYWLRARLKEDGPPGEPLMNAVFANAVWATQHETIIDEPMGASDGRPGQVFRFRRIPVLEGQEIDVREISGLQANIEWRMLALELFGGDPRRLAKIEGMLAAEGAEKEITEGRLRLVRDRAKRVTEVWVRWQPVEHFYDSGPSDRHYMIDGPSGRLFFGDGQQGKAPPPGARIAARRYRTGGGRAANLPAYSISQLIAPAGGVDTIFNPVPAEGGADGETWESFAQRGPASLRHRGRALSLADYETMAREASAAVAMARAVAGLDGSGRGFAGRVTLEIVPNSAERRPWPSFGLREQVRRYITERAPAGLLESGILTVTGPEYQPIDVRVTVVPLDPAEAGLVEERVRLALERFLHPLTGGPGGQGWEAGRDVFLSDLASVLERVEGVDYLTELGLSANDRAFGESLPVSPGRLVVAGEVRIKVIQEEG